MLLVWSSDVPDISWVSEGERNTSCSDIHSKLTLNIESTEHCTFYFCTMIKQCRGVTCRGVHYKNVNQVKNAKGIIQWKSKGLFRHVNLKFMSLPLPVLAFVMIMVYIEIP